MDAIQEYFRKPLVAGIAGAVLGLILGLFIAWVAWPVQFTDAGPQHLAFNEKVDYLRMTMIAYARDGDVAQARQRYEKLGQQAPEALAQIKQSPGDFSQQLIDSFDILVVGGMAAQTPVAGATTEPGATPPPPAAGGGIMGALLPILCVVLLLVIAAAIVYFIMRSRGAVPTVATTPAMQAREAARQAAWTDYAAAGQEPPMAQYMASYKLGDDLFDDSFSIDSPAGEFMGECGVGISETIGVGDPKKVTAFEVWLFDKNDIQTVTKVYMSEHAFIDDATRQRLAAKGEPVLAEPGAETVLETQTLQMVARVVDMGYGEGALPAQSFFDRFIIELAIWPK